MDFERYESVSIPGDECDTPRGNGMALRMARLSRDGFSQCIEVYCAVDPYSREVRVTGIGSVLKNTDITDLRALIGKTFTSCEELERTLRRQGI